MAKKKEYDLPIFQEAREWQERINEVKDMMVGMGPIDLARQFALAKKIKKDYEARVKDCNTEIEALSQLLVDYLHGQELQKIQLESGGTVYLDVMVRPSVEDQSLFLQWVRDSKLEEILSVHAKKIEGIVKTCLNNGEDLPPGVEAYKKIRAKYLK